MRRLRPDRQHWIALVIMTALSLVAILITFLLFNHQIDCRDDGECVTAGLMSLPGVGVVLVSLWSVMR